MSRENKVRAAKDHGKRLQNELLAVLSIQTRPDPQLSMKTI